MKTYATPTLQPFGSVKDLTRANFMSSMNDTQFLAGHGSVTVIGGGSEDGCAEKAIKDGTCPFN